MRIAHITATFPPDISGTGNVCYYNTLELARRGHYVTVFTARSDSAAQKDLPAGFQSIQVARLPPLVRSGNAALLPQLFTRLGNFDVIHLHYPFFGGEAAALAAKKYHIPLVITYHQDVLLVGFSGLIEKILRPTISRLVLRSASYILFTSLDYAEASYARPLLRGCNIRIGALANGVDIDQFKPVSSSETTHPVSDRPLPLSEKYRLQSADLVVLLVATLDKAHYFKGIPILLDAMLGLPDNVKALIVGEGNLRSTYEAAAQAAGLAERVIFTGRVPAQILPDYYRLADVTVLPSTTMGEAFGLVLIESLSCGTPVIASNLPGVRTVVADGIDGYLAAPGDADDLGKKLSRILDLPPEIRRAMGLSGREKVAEKYAWPVIGAQLESIYQGCLVKP